MIKLIALDLDDTLLTTDKKISEGNRQALKACIDRGISVITASGRFNESQRSFIIEMGLGLESQPHLGDGGGTIFNHEGVIRKMGAFTPDVYADLLQQTREIGIPGFVTNGENVFYDVDEHPLLPIYNVRQEKVKRQYIHRIEDLGLVKEPLKFVFCHNTIEEYKKICSLQHSEAVNISAGRNLREITMRHLTKLNGLKEIIKLYGVEMDEVACFGDSENDIPMIQGAGMGFAVANAAEDVKAAADIVGSKTNDEDGVAWLIERYIL